MAGTLSPHAVFLDEPDLIFGHRREEKDPRIGLKQFGPFFHSFESSPKVVSVQAGIIGTAETVTLADRTLKMLTQEVSTLSTNRWLYADFPGFKLDNQIKCEIVASLAWRSIIKPDEIQRVLDIPDSNERIAAGAESFTSKIPGLLLEDDQPNVLIFALPLSIEDYCGISPRTRGAKRPKFTELERRIHNLKSAKQSFLADWGFQVPDEVTEAPQKGYDLRNSLKGRSMRFGIPIQILRESTMRAVVDYPNPDFKTREDPAAFAWNLSTALYYKANGRPWRLAKLPEGTCYVGVAFYTNLRSPDLELQTSMAQVFTHSGEGFVLRGTDVRVDKDTREPRLTKEQANQLLHRALQKYTERVKVPPSRVVLHKTSRFTSEEKEGFLTAIGASDYDFVAILKDSPIRFLRVGEYPVLRGTLISLTQNEHILYTAGYTPRLRTYPGLRIPVPLHIINEGASEAAMVCQEILGLTKLNWNTTKFYTTLPITLEFAKRVGRILSELEGEEIQDHYRFYM